jgi:hypothetical protein
MGNIKEKVLIEGLKIRDLFAKHPVITKAQKSEIRPFFIISAGRSGSTLLRTLLVKGGEVNIPPETNNILPTAYVAFYKLLTSKWEVICERVLAEFINDDSFQYWHLDRNVLYEKLVSIPTQERSLAKIFDEIYQAFNSSSGIYWGDKTPFLNQRIPFVLNIFPNAKFVNLIRDGRDVIASRVHSLGGESTLSAANRWVTSLQLSAHYEKKLPDRQWLNLYYEDLVTHPEANLRRVCEFINIPFHDIMINGESNLDLGDTVLAHHANTKNKISASAIGKWKKTMNPKDMQAVSSIISPSLVKHGYKH